MIASKVVAGSEAQTWLQFLLAEQSGKKFPAQLVRPHTDECAAVPFTTAMLA